MHQTGRYGVNTQSAAGAAHAAFGPKRRRRRRRRRPPADRVAAANFPFMPDGVDARQEAEIFYGRLGR